MLKGPQHESGEKAGSIVIELPESVKSKLPRDFNIDEIGKIDLREAETIANEDILFINENEIIEDLEDFDLIPVKKDEAEMFDETPERDDMSMPGRSKASYKNREDRDSAIAAGKPSQVGPDDHDDEFIARAIREDEPATGKTETAPDEDGERMQIIENDFNDGKRWIPVEKVLESDVTTQAADDKKPSIIEGYVEGDDEYIIWDIPPAEFETSKAAQKPEHREPSRPHREAESSGQSIKDTSPAAPDMKRTVPDEDEVVISTEKFPESTRPARETAAVVISPVDHNEESGTTAREKRPAGGQPVAADIVADGAARLHKGESFRENGEVVFIDDRTALRSDEQSVGSVDGELDKIVSGIVRIDEGPAYLLGEAGIEEDRERIALIAEDLSPVDEEQFIDLDYKYGDDELDYIHTAITEEDYGDYISEIDEFFGTRGGRTVPRRIELLGLTADEFDMIEDLLFKGDFKDIHLYDRYQLYEFDRGARDEKSMGSKNCRYLLPAENSIMDVERDSIESDISAGSALIFEEDVEEIKDQLKKRTGKTDSEIAVMLERAVNASTDAEQHVMKEEIPAAVVVEETEEPVELPEGASSPHENLYDITDRVVILDDKADVDRFISGFPERKRMNIKMLLKYLDGLFEKLPEETIKKFASSDYFELYLKVLNELGV